MKFLPTKHIPLEETVFGVASAIRRTIHKGATVEQLWRRSRSASNVGTFERFIIGLDYLYATGAIELKDNRIVEVQHAE